MIFGAPSETQSSSSSLALREDAELRASPVCECTAPAILNKVTDFYEAQAVEQESVQYQSFHPSSAVVSECSNNKLDDFIEQLQYYAAKAPSTVSTVSTTSDSTTYRSTTSLLDTVDYDTDGTDFLPRIETPCPRRSQPESKPEAPVFSKYFSNSTHTRDHSVPVKRRLWPGSTTKSRLSNARSPKKSTTQKTDPNRILRDIERASPHKLDYRHKELLCLLNRWFVSADNRAIPRIFRAIFGLELSDAAIRTMWDGHCLWYGPECCQEYADVFSCPFQGSRYDSTIEAIERLASNLGIGLDKREQEPNFIAGRAKFSKTPGVRKRFKDLSRRLSRKGSYLTYSSKLESVGDTYVGRLGGFPVEVSPESNDDVLVISDNTPVVAPNEEAITAGRRRDQKSLAFRVWDLER